MKGIGQKDQKAALGVGGIPAEAAPGKEEESLEQRWEPETPGLIFVFFCFCFYFLEANATHLF